MTEVLYCPEVNELFLFNGKFEVDTERLTLVIYVAGSKKLGMGLKTKNKTLKLDAKNLVHIGWL